MRLGQFFKQLIVPDSEEVSTVTPPDETEQGVDDSVVDGQTAGSVEPEQVPVIEAETEQEAVEPEPEFTQVDEVAEDFVVEEIEQDDDQGDSEKLSNEL